MGYKVFIQKSASKKQVKNFLEPNWKIELKNYSKYFVITFLCVSLLYTFLRFFAFNTIQVNGESMYPYHTTGDTLYIDLISPYFSNYRRGEVVVLNSPKSCDDKEELFIKRIIGLPNEKLIISKGDIYIFNSTISQVPIKLNENEYLDSQLKTHIKPEVLLEVEPKIDEEFFEIDLASDQYFFMGDNRNSSIDSRVCGPIAKNNILGKEIFILTPQSKQGFFELPKYNIPNI
jgi:signal peptidase I